MVLLQTRNSYPMCVKSIPASPAPFSFESPFIRDKCIEDGATSAVVFDNIQLWALLFGRGKTELPTSVTHRIPQLSTFSESSSVTNDVLVPGHYFWVTSIWQPPPQLYNPSDSCMSYNMDHSTESFYHNYYNTTSPGPNPITPPEVYYNFFSDINITDITDEAQGEKVAPTWR